jgi:hypothetical protein
VILRPLISDEPPRGSAPAPIWPVIERTQTPRRSECWLIPQPAHAALSGEIASQLDPRYFPGMNQEVVQAIALHDAGWGMADAEAIQRSRAVKKNEQAVSPKSFINFPPAETINIWTFSIDTAQKLSSTGGYIVSQHFARIGQTQVGKYDSKHAAAFARFAEQERRRQDKLQPKTGRSVEELEPLVTALQFTDLLSLYISCGVLEDAVFPHKLNGREITLRRSGPGECSLDPFPLAGPVIFTISGIRHPRADRSHANAQSFSLRVTAE